MKPPELSGSTALVTGGAGFIGSHLVDALLAQGARVRVLDNFATGSAGNLEHCDGRIDLIREDIRDLAACRRACQGVDLVFHQAALGSVPRSLSDPATTVAVNVAGSANVLAAARDAKVRRVVYASSSSVYGESGAPAKREGEEAAPLSPYAASKVMDERLAEIFGRCYGMELIGLRYFNVYGPRQDPDGPYAAVIPRFFRASLRGVAPVIYGDGEQTRDFTFVADAVDANLLAAAAAAEACGRAYNVAGGRRTSVNELARRIGELVPGSPPPVREPARAGDVRDSCADLTLAGRAIGYQPSVSLTEGLALAFGHYRRHYGDGTDGLAMRGPVAEPLEKSAS
ncbi:MAG: NAD-dependent epimerase/dehydratase family protein [Thermoanaerobaculia bacterium]